MSYPLAMAEIPFVKPEEAELARDMESRLLRLRADAGILFVGVSVQPTKVGEAPVFHVWLGCTRNTTEELMHHLVASTFHPEIASGIKIEVEAHRGVIRS